MKLLKDIFTYAFRGSGKYIFFFCVVLSLIGKITSFAPAIGGIAWLFISTYFCATYFQMIRSSANAEKEAPEFPTVTSLIDDLIMPMLQTIGVCIVSFGPLLGYILWAGEAGNRMVGYGLLAFGVVYYPMAMLAVVVLGYAWALSPHIVVPAIFRGGWLYWLAVVLLSLLYFGLGWVSDTDGINFWVEPFVLSIISTYTLMTNARILGVVYRERKEQLGWW